MLPCLCLTFDMRRNYLHIRFLVCMWRIAETSAALDRQNRRGKKIVELKFIPVLRKRFKKAFTKIKATVTQLRKY